VGAVSVVLAADVAAPSAARQFVRRNVPRGELHAQVPTAQLLVSELVTNAVRYGKGDTVRVVVDVGPRRLVVSVTDRNPLPPQLVGAANEQGGRGMLLVDALASGWGTAESDGGKTVWFALDAP